MQEGVTNMSFLRDLRVAFYSLMRTQGLAITVILTLALGIGANAAIFTLVRGVLLKPLVNRDEDRLIYIRQSAPGAGDDNSTFSVLEPSVPYPQDTEIIANVVTSPHHLSATMVTDRLHRMTELFGRLAPGVTLGQARVDLRTVYGAMTKEHPADYSPKANYQIGARLLRDQITSGARTVLLVLLAASALVFIIACSYVAHPILTRTLRREGELAIRASPYGIRGGGEPID